ncbi:hypothetical protein [Paenibacillus sp. 22594]|uniref:hypothetical protein n=1 Tax=Paenibacillus sp. 22594 TaxID=3453947 RepID=UPI003F86079D
MKLLERISDLLERDGDRHVVRQFLLGLGLAPFSSWSHLALEFSYPSVAQIHKQMAKSYEHDAIWEDERAGVSRRLLE